MPEIKSSSWYPPYHIFVCPECDENAGIEPDKSTGMEREEFLKHLKDAHGMDKPKGKRSLIMHMNKRPRHCASFEWTISDKTFYEYYG